MADLQSRQLFRIPVRGTHYYQAREAVKANLLKLGMRLRLLPRPENRYDKTAVEVRANDGMMLGHVPRDRSEEVFELVKAGKVNSVRVYSLDVRTNNIKIEIEIEFVGGLKEAARPSKILRPSGTAKPELTVQPVPESPPIKESYDWIWWLIGAIALLFVVS